MYRGLGVFKYIYVINSIGKMKYSLISLFFIFTALQVYSQNSVVETYLSDKVQEKNNIIKTDIPSYFKGEWNIYYERRLNKKITCEIGSGVFLTHYRSDLYLVDFQDLTSTFRETGSYTLSARLKFYSKQALFYHYQGINFKYTDLEQIKYFDIGYNIGYQPFLSKTVGVDMSAGFDIRFNNPGNTINIASEQPVAFIFSIKAMLGIKY